MIPKLPTDNLYKFVAISGLVLLLSAGYLREAQRMQLHKDVALSNSEVSNLNSMSKQLDEDIKQLSPSAKGPFIANGVLYQTVNEARASLHSKQLVLREIRSAQKTRQDVLKASEGNLKSIWYWTQSAQYVGGILMIIGFSLWYVKVQRYQDEILRKESRYLGMPAGASKEEKGSSLEIEE